MLDNGGHLKALLEFSNVESREHEKLLLFYSFPTVDFPGYVYVDQSGTDL